MTNELTRVLDAIKQDPHGEVARLVAHWLAVEVMGWKYVDNERHPEKNHYIAQGLQGIKTGEWARVMFQDEWQPLTDANHTRMLVLKCGLCRVICQGFVSYSLKANTEDIRHFELYPYSDNITHDACQVMRKCHAEGTLTDEILKGF